MKLFIFFITLLYVSFSFADVGDDELAPGSLISLNTEITFDSHKGWRSAHFKNGEQIALDDSMEGKDHYCGISIYAREKNPKIKDRVFVASPYQHIEGLRGSHQGLILEGTAASGKPVSMYIACMNPDSQVYSGMTWNDRNTELLQLQQHAGEFITFKKTMVGNLITQGAGVYIEIETEIQ